MAYSTGKLLGNSRLFRFLYNSISQQSSMVYNMR